MGNFDIISEGPEMFFIDTIVVPPNRFRPENKGGSDGGVYLHQQSTVLTKIINLSNRIRELLKQQNPEKIENENKEKDEKKGNKKNKKNKDSREEEKLEEEKNNISDKEKEAQN